MNRVYLDHAASTPLRRAAMDAMRPYLTGFYGNPSSAHEEGRRARQAIEKARETIAGFLHASADPTSVYFLPSATAANNLAIGVVGWISAVFLLSPLEHSSVYNAIPAQRKPRMIPLDRYGRVTPDAIRSVNDEFWAKAGAVCWVCSETGVVNPISEIAPCCDDQFVYLMTDATQGIGHLPIDFLDHPPDCLTFGAHKFGGPRGVGVLVCYNDFALEQYMAAGHKLIRGGHQERGIWPGTENTAAIVGAAAALTDAMENMEERTEKTLLLRNRLLDRLTDIDNHILLNTPKNPECCVPGIFNVSVPWMDGADIVMRMDDAGFAVSSGSACSTGEKEPSRVIMAASGGDERRARGSVRFSFNDLNTLEEIDAAMDCFKTIVMESKNHENH